MTEQQDIEEILARNRDLIEALKNLASRIRGEHWYSDPDEIIAGFTEPEKNGLTGVNGHPEKLRDREQTNQH
ncbi:MAG TPA: hypothetical protein P5228_02045 [Bacteroidales bacterium]|nr:hypothetical protein [Bacteroidales bacterium]HRZ49496.1 hypothetical protein [Bacteroidales bacterium]